MRIYLPTTLPALRQAVAASAVGGESTLACAVTPTLREWYAEGDLEELEYAALTEAARASLRLLADDDGPPRRVVLAADVADGAVSPAPARGKAAVRLAGPVPLSQIVSAHVDDADAEGDVRAAVSALDAAERGDPDARFAVDAVEDHELLWYAAQEIPSLSRL